eukprot:2306824-Pleurochrysis_carterae.AAC.2
MMQLSTARGRIYDLALRQHNIPPSCGAPDTMRSRSFNRGILRTIHTRLAGLHRPRERPRSPSEALSHVGSFCSVLASVTSRLSST